MDRFLSGGEKEVSNRAIYFKQVKNKWVAFTKSILLLGSKIE